MRLNQFDILKAIGIILVIVGHTLGYNILRNIITSFHMPLFFLISGYFFKMKEPMPLINKLSKRLLIPYLLTCFIIVLLSCIVYSINNTFDTHYFFNWLKSIMYGNGVTDGTQFQSIGPLWFLLALFWGTIMLHLIIYFSQYISSTFVSILCVIMAMFLSQHKIFLPLSILQGMLCVGYLYIGYLIKQYHPSIILKSKLSWIIIAIIWIISFKSGYLSMAQCYANPELLALTGALGGTYFAYILSERIAHKEGKLCSILTHLGKMTLLILCVHSVEYNIVSWDALLNKIDLNYYLSNSIIILVRVLIVISISLILQRFKLIREIFNL